ncbi:MAG: hypothetical protein ACRCTZ_02395 [Sarcina sp.]
MSKFFSLVKYSIKDSIGKSNKSKNKLNGIGLYILVGMIFAVSIFVMLGETMGMLKTVGLPSEFVFVIIYMLIAGGIFSTDVVKSAGMIFNVKDFQLLASLPISSGQIILSKVANLLLFNYLFVLVGMVPAFIVYTGSNGFNGQVLLLVIIESLFTPFIPMALAIGLGYIFYKISSKFKYKEIALTAVTLIGLVIFLGIVYSAQMWLPKILENAQYLIDIISKFYLPIQFLGTMMMEKSWINALWFALSSVGVFAVFMFIIRNTFFKMNSKFIVFGKSTQTAIKDGVQQSKVISLFKTEIVKYFSKGVVVLNTVTGGLIYIVFIVLGALKVLPMDPNMIIIMGCFMFAISPTTATSISLEGKAFNMKKALPISAKDVIKSKLLVNIAVNLPFAVVGTAINIILGAEFVTALIGFAAIVCSLLFASIFGLLADMKFYNFNWNSEAEVVKRGKSVLVTMLPSFLVFMITMAIKIPGLNMGLIILGVYGVAMVLAGIVLIARGEIMYNKIGTN